MCVSVGFNKVNEFINSKVVFLNVCQKSLIARTSLKYRKIYYFFKNDLKDKIFNILNWCLIQTLYYVSYVLQYTKNNAFFYKFTAIMITIHVNNTIPPRNTLNVPKGVVKRLDIN